MMRIMVDNGHFGFDSGAVGPAGLKEVGVNFLVASRVVGLLRQAGHDARLTVDGATPRPASIQEDLARRCQAANDWTAALFLSIHCNAAADRSAHGTETYCYRCGGEGERLARLIQAELVAATGLADRGVKEANFYVLRETRMPAVLVELAFISNPAEEQLLADPEWQERCALAVAQGVVKYAGRQMDPGRVRVCCGPVEIAGMLINDHTYAPVRALAEALGRQVRWNEDDKSVEII